MLYAVIHKNAKCVHIYESSKIGVLSEAGLVAYIKNIEGLSSLAFSSLYKVEFLGREIERLSKKYRKYEIIYK